MDRTTKADRKRVIRTESRAIVALETLRELLPGEEHLARAYNEIMAALEEFLRQTASVAEAFEWMEADEKASQVGDTDGVDDEGPP